MSDFSIADYEQLLVDADEMAVRVLSMSVANLYNQMREDPTLRIRGVDIQAINAFRRIAKEAYEAQLAQRDDGPKISDETRESFGVASNEELIQTLDAMATAAQETLAKQSEPRPTAPGNRQERRIADKLRKRRSKQPTRQPRALGERHLVKRSARPMVWRPHAGHARSARPPGGRPRHDMPVAPIVAHLRLRSTIDSA